MQSIGGGLYCNHIAFSPSVYLSIRTVGMVNHVQIGRAYVHTALFMRSLHISLAEPKAIRMKSGQKMKVKGEEKVWTRKEKEREKAKKKKGIWKGRRKRVTEESLRETGQAKIKKKWDMEGEEGAYKRRERERVEKKGYGGRASRWQEFSIHDYGSTLGTDPECI